MKQNSRKNRPFPQSDPSVSMNSCSDEELFLEAMADVREITEFREIPYTSPRPVPIRKRKEPDCHETLKRIVGGEEKMTISLTGEYIEWLCPEARRDLAGRLHRGEFAVQDYIDLHGMTQGEAETSFADFMRQAIRKRLACVKVIHGRGLRSPRGPVLKSCVESWLRGNLRKWVIAYATARDSDGGLGASYVLLKTRG